MTPTPPKLLEDYNVIVEPSSVMLNHVFDCHTELKNLRRRLKELQNETKQLQFFHHDNSDPRNKVLYLLSDGEISVGKACEALNEIAAGNTPALPDAEPRFDDEDKSWKERAEKAESRLEYLDGLTSGV